MPTLHLSPDQWDALEAAVLENVEGVADTHRAYTGRYTDGRACIAFVLDDDSSTILRLGHHLDGVLAAAELTTVDPDTFITNARTDDHGPTTTILCFPGITVDDDQDEETDPDAADEDTDDDQ